MPTNANDKTAPLHTQTDELHFSASLAELNELDERTSAFWEDSGHFSI